MKHRHPVNTVVMEGATTMQHYLKSKKSASAAFVIVFLLSASPVFAQPPVKLVGSPDIVPPATAEMQNPEFWISRIEGDPTRVIMTPAQIDGLNRRNAVRSLAHTDINGAETSIDSVLVMRNFSGIRYHIDDPLAMTAMDGTIIRQRLETSADALIAAEYWDRRFIPFPEADKRAIVETMQTGAVPAVIRPRHGVTVRHTLVRVYPAHERAYRSQYNWLDMFQCAVLETGQAVAVLHETKNRDWLYVRSEYCEGWVPALNVAFGKPGEIRRFASPERFVVAIGHKAPVLTKSAEGVFLLDLYMGSRLPLERTSAGGYGVIVPVRLTDGSLGEVAGWIAEGTEVSVGYQSYTQRNVITTVFRLLNRPYGWGGTDNERDCVGTIRAVLRTFGINTPRWTVFQLYSADHVTTFPADTPKEEKYRLLSKCAPGITVGGFDWHVVLYLGEVDGVHYIIHQNGYSYHDGGGDEVRVARVSVNSTELEGGADIAKWTELSEFRP